MSDQEYGRAFDEWNGAWVFITDPVMDAGGIDRLVMLQEKVRLIQSECSSAAVQQCSSATVLLRGLRGLRWLCCAELSCAGVEWTGVGVEPGVLGSALFDVT